MPLDASDFEKIQAMIGKVETRLENMSMNFVTQKVADDRFSAMLERIVKLETTQSRIGEYILTENEKTRTLITTAVKEVSEQVDDVKEGLALSRSTTLRYIIYTIVSFTLGVISFYIITHLH